jgi:hypothetical protein
VFSWGVRLRDYPYIVFRIACRECPRIGRYRLAVLAERFVAHTGGVFDVIGIMVGTITGSSSTAPTATGSHSESLGTTDPQLVPSAGTITVPTNGAAVIFTGEQYGPITLGSWTNTSSGSGDYYLATSTGNGTTEMLAHSYATGAQSYSVSGSGGNGFSFGGFSGVVAAWGP